MKTIEDASDEDLLLRMASGDEEAFGSLYRRRQAGVYRFALQMSGSTTIAEEVTQDVFMVLIRDPKSWDPARGSLAAWLYGIARNHVLRTLERDRNSLPQAEEEWQEPVATGDVLHNLTRGEAIESVRAAVLALPASYREVVVLCDLEELSYAETAAALGCAVGTVRSRLHRGRALLLLKLRRPANRARCTA